MKKFLNIFLILFFSTSLLNAAEGEFGFGIEGGYSAVDLESEKSAQEIANALGETVTVNYNTGLLVGRIFANYGITSDIDVEAGYFASSTFSEKYTMASGSASIDYDFSGFDVSGIVKHESGFFGKAGMHSATLNGAASVVIGGTTVTLTGAADGTGPLIGGGYESGNVRYSLTHYSDLAGVDDFTLFSIGYKFN
tara:strand:+ start:606 stop:1190 length:585 start_codon:yes stop_codon:yes gene_type:complete